MATGRGPEQGGDLAHRVRVRGQPPAGLGMWAEDHPISAVGQQPLHHLHAVAGQGPVLHRRGAALRGGRVDHRPGQIGGGQVVRRRFRHVQLRPADDAQLAVRVEVVQSCSV
jgi:hypothetical protein